ncbi:hypothetical protein IC744_01775 [Microbacterium hominis]|uniref:hypothetical protein n=1 Tax=Microbacterium hominis TaxID=162426 RepID=UPI00168ABAB7|nr:hypothetical protein [Microbacterium hominis]QOC25151.1 hypothetical protein IC745_12425 [Microbacterium hominis]QOC29186.1 hypothetical protein IC744_01775 [Microbacterium hominis]
MKRIDLHYGGQVYSIGGQSIEELQQTIADALTSDNHWIRVNDGEGRRRDAFLLISPGAPLALIPIPGSDET